MQQLKKADVPTLDEMRLNRGQPYRAGHYPPFPTRTWKASAVICARWDRSTDEGALREWLDHHRHALSSSSTDSRSCAILCLHGTLASSFRCSVCA